MSNTLPLELIYSLKWHFTTHKNLSKQTTHLTWRIPEGMAMSTTSGSHTDQIQWLQDTAAGPQLIRWWETPLLLTLVTFPHWVILQGLSVTKSVMHQFKPCKHDSDTFIDDQIFTRHVYWQVVQDLINLTKNF